MFGELRTKHEFKNYHLRMQFKWGEKKWAPRDRPETPRDSGLLYHVHAAPGAEGRTWARSIELQIQEKDVGDLYAVGSTIAVRVESRARAPNRRSTTTTRPGTGRSSRKAMASPDAASSSPTTRSRPASGTLVELIAFGEDAIHIVNGKVVMRLHGPMQIDAAVPTPVTSGPIILQSEGAELFYRDIEFRPITAIPAEFAAK